MTRDKGKPDPGEWTISSEENVRKALKDVFNETCRIFDEKADAIKAEAWEFVFHRVSAAEPERLGKDVKEFIALRVGEEFEMNSHAFERKLTDIVSRVYAGDGRASRERRISLVGELWGKKKPRSDIEESIARKEVRRRGAE